MDVTEKLYELRVCIENLRMENEELKEENDCLSNQIYDLNIHALELEKRLNKNE